MRIAIVGGQNHNQETYGKLLKKAGQVEIHFYDGIPKKHNKKNLEKLIKDVDFVIVILGACSHASMWDVKKAAKKCDKELLFSRGIGISSIVNQITGQPAFTA
ncbi:MAG TPA: DUF2325 domain-containing protein [Desulfitobacterium dehalogenans]|uniref:DUF2325 domain-containing protein n=1 Tax=Desulfitobacterium dehalogenans TaxID=36854 RepID=A0A7C7D8I4_9FIRM|nr:DUF2325 domain-containing protein [Desulfitobacterium dehalogenans]